MSFPGLLRAVPLMTITERVPFPQAPEAGVFVGRAENRGSGCRWQRLCQGHTVRLRDPHMPPDPCKLPIVPLGNDGQAPRSPCL